MPSRMKWVIRIAAGYCVLFLLLSMLMKTLFMDTVSSQCSLSFTDSREIETCIIVGMGQYTSRTAHIISVIVLSTILMLAWVASCWQRRNEARAQSLKQDANDP